MEPAHSIDIGESAELSLKQKLTVLAPTIISIAVTPEVAGVEANGTRQFTATATRSDSTTQDVTTTATWTSSDTDVATINNTGLALGLSEGSSTIRATLNSSLKCVSTHKQQKGEFPGRPERTLASLK